MEEKQNREKQQNRRTVENLDAQRTKLINDFEKQDIDPDLLGRIQYCVKTVVEAGEVPEHRKTIEEQLKPHAPQKPKTHRNKPGGEIPWPADKNTKKRRII